MRSNYLWYQFFRFGIVWPSLHLFYSDISVSGKERIPDNKPILFIPNHQNAFLDALHVATNTRIVIHFLTRAKPFKQPVLGRFLRSINMLPVYRVRNGFSAIKKNEQIFEECFRRLKQKEAVLVFAEASQDLKRRIRPLSKGFTRIAFGAEEKYNWDLDLQVVPVGISYEEHKKARTAVHLQFGEPIPVMNFRKQFAKDEREAAQDLKRLTAERLKKLTMHVPKLNHYPLHRLLLDDLENERKALLNSELVNERVKKIEKSFSEERLKEAEELIGKAEKYNIDLRDLLSRPRFRFTDLLFSPAYIFSLVNNIIPFQAVRWVTEDYIEDHVFDASAKYIMGLLGLPFWYLLVSGVLALSGLDLMLIAIYILFSIITAPYFVRAKDLLTPDPAKKLKKEKPSVYEFLKSKVEKFREWRDQLF